MRIELPRFALVVLTLVALAGSFAAIAEAGVVYPPDFQPRRGSYRAHESQPREPWQRWHVFAGGTLPLPLAPRRLVKWFSPRPGMTLGTQGPVTHWLDVDVEADFTRLPFDAGKFDLGSPQSVGEAHFDGVMLAARIHPDAVGWRPFATLAVGLPGIDTPSISYTDRQGNPQEDLGTELFGFDWGFALGGGIEWNAPGRFGVFADARLMAFPGRTEPTHSALPLRIALTSPLPFGR